MDFNEYQNQAMGTSSYPDIGKNIVYPALGLAGEAGEAVDKIKKLYRNKGYTSGLQYSSFETEELAKELGDVLWYIAAISQEMGWTLNEVAGLNIRKLKDRHARGVIKSEGDNR